MTHDERVHELLYSNEDRAELCERMVELEELVRDMWFGLYCPTEPTDGCPQCPFNRDGECFFEQHMRELGIEVPDA